jgi:hypothetical protein
MTQHALAQGIETGRPGSSCVVGGAPSGRRAGATLVAVVVLQAVAAGVLAQQAAPQESWQQQVRSQGLSERDIDHLTKEKVLVGAQESKQSFELYNSGLLPFFITSDSLLNGFNVLLLESVRRWEQHNAATLPDLLQGMWTCLNCGVDRVEGSAELVEAARRRARIVVGVALRLVGRGIPGVDDAVRGVIDGEVGKVQAASSVEMPGWLGPSRPGFLALDYTRFRPRGIYAADDMLRGYFQAVKWMQAIPFRLGSDEELLAFVLIGCPAYAEREGGECGRWRDGLGSFIAHFTWMGGTQSEKGIVAVLDTMQTTLQVDGADSDLAMWREDLRGEYGLDEDTDQLRVPPDGQRAPEQILRVFPSLRLPETSLFALTTDPSRFPGRSLPDGLEIVAALGSALSRQRLAEGQPAALLDAIDGAQEEFGGGNLVHQYYDCLRTLLDEPEPDAPALLRGRPWQLKSAHAALSGWAQFRHALVLQAQESVIYAGVTDTPAGFVEPEPEFFSRLASLVGNVRATLKSSSAFEPDWRLAVPIARDARARVEQLAKDPALGDGPGIWPVDYLSLAFQPTVRHPRDLDLVRARASLDELIRDLESGVAPANPEVRQILTYLQVDLEGSWELLESLSLRLAAMAHKQLRGRPWNTIEENIIKGYGAALGNVMLYEGNSWLVPKDDAPRVIDVASNPADGKVLLVGIGRPRALYVLYPWQGREVLCRGAVLPYHELASPTRLSDVEWLSRMDSANHPPPPAWVLPLLSERPIRPPATQDE